MGSLRWEMPSSRFKAVASQIFREGYRLWDRIEKEWEKMMIWTFLLGIGMVGRLIICNCWKIKLNGQTFKMIKKSLILKKGENSAEVQLSGVLCWRFAQFYTNCVYFGRWHFYKRYFSSRHFPRRHYEVVSKHSRCTPEILIPKYTVLLLNLIRYIDGSSFNRSLVKKGASRLNGNLFQY